MRISLGVRLLLALALALPLGAQNVCPRERGLNGVAGYYTPGDRYQHAIVSNDGSLYEIFFDPARGIFQSSVARLRDTIALAGFAAPLDANRQIILAARRDGEIHQVWLGPSGIGSALLDRVNGTIDVGGIYSSDTGRQRAIAVTNTGDVVELAWQPGMGVTRTTLTNIAGATHVAGFFTRDDFVNIALVTTNRNEVWEIFYKNPASIGKSVIATTAEPIVDVAGFYSDDDQFRHAILALRGGGIQEVFYHPVKGKGSSVVTTVPGVRHIAGYTTAPHDRTRHVILGLDDGSVRELFFNPATGKGVGVLRTYTQEFTAGEDTSAEGPNAVQPQPYSSTAGLMTAVAGNDVVLYSVSLNAGVWRSDAARAWRQLGNSPQRTASMAQDPGNALHIAAGERAGDAGDPVLNRSGVWESRDGGNSWSYILNPRTLGGGCSSQAIPALAFDRDGALYAATDCGIAKRLAGASAFTLLAGSGGAPVTNVVTHTVGTAVWVWARTQSEFLLSKDAGTTWERIAIPAMIGPDAIRHGTRGEPFSIAAFDTTAFTIGSTSRGGAALALDGNTKIWSLTDIRDGDGTGLGGRRFVKAVFVNNPAPRWVLLAGTGQGMFLGDVAAGRINRWKRIAETPWIAVAPDKHEFVPVSTIHVDLWDAHVADGPDPVIWLTTDGGVYRTTLSAAVASAPGVSPPYRHQNAGLKTMHAHTISLVTESPVRRSKVAFATADNNEWVRTSTPIVAPEATWRHWGFQGDSNWTAADNGGALAIIMRNGQTVHLTAFGDPAPPAAKFWAEAPRRFTIYPAGGFQAEQFIHVIQSAKGEPPNPLLDVVMLSHLPLATPNPANTKVLIRSRTFASNPDQPTSKFAAPAWTVEDAALPNGAQRVWASGGRTVQGGPVYYLYAEDGAPRVFRRAAAGSPWIDLTPAIGAPLLPPAYGAVSGPVFPNPYDRNHVLVLTSRGVRVSLNGGTTFADDEVLTALITGSGTYPLTSMYSGANPTQVVHFSQARAMGTLADVAFLRENSTELVVASPYTGLFYRNTACGTWQSLTPFLPRPLTAIGSVGIDHEAVYAAIDGRSVWRVRAYELAPAATYYRRDGLAGGQVARLVRADGPAVSGQAVRVIATRPDGTEVFNGPLVTDGAGGIVLPALPPGLYVVHASFNGATGVSGSGVSFTVTL